MRTVPEMGADPGGRGGGGGDQGEGAESGSLSFCGTLTFNKRGKQFECAHGCTPF